MKEYNWRKEREKYRPDFRKEPETAAPAAASEVPAAAPAPRSGAAKWIILLAVIVIAGMIGGGIYLFRNQDSSARLAAVAEKNKSAVGLVTLHIELTNGKKFSVPIGTAWAFAENKFATNAHVANGLKEALQKQIQGGAQGLIAREAKKHNCKTVKEYLQKQGKNAPRIVQNALKQIHTMIKDVQARIAINGGHQVCCNITHVQIHRNYGAVDSKMIPDVAVLTVQEKVQSYFKLADSQDLKSLKTGTPIAFLGFPMELLANDNINLDNPVASMQSGIVVAVSDFEMKDAGFSGNYLIRHNLPSTGGASGSPIFNKHGKVVALLFAGNTTNQVKNNKIVRAPSAAQINFAVRVDLLSGMGKAVELKKFLFN